MRRAPPPCAALPRCAAALCAALCAAPAAPDWRACPAARRLVERSDGSQSECTVVEYDEVFETFTVNIGGAVCKYGVEVTLNLLLTLTVILTLARTLTLALALTVTLSQPKP